MSCYACGRDAIHRCPRCAKPYCDQHGGELCAACQDPSSAIPSGAVFRGALLALLVASVLALWLLIRPPGDDESGAQAGQPSATRTPVATATARPSPSVSPTGTPGVSPTPGGGTPSASPTPEATPTVQATTTPVPSPTPEPSPFLEYTVQPGDSLSSIAAQFGTTADELARINSLADPNALSVGQTLQVPRPETPSPTPSP
jgi:LysM repeat protein